MSPLVNVVLIAVGPFVIVGVLLLLARAGSALSERDAETLRQLGQARVENAERKEGR